MANLPPPAPLVRALLGITLVLVVGCREDAQAPTETGAAPQLAVSGQPLSFRQVAAGSGYTCGVTTANVGYCWGNDAVGQLGDGSRTNRLRPVKIAGGLKFIEVRAGGAPAAASRPTAWRTARAITRAVRWATTLLRRGASFPRWSSAGTTGAR